MIQKRALSDHLDENLGQYQNPIVAINLHNTRYMAKNHTKGAGSRTTPQERGRESPKKHKIQKVRSHASRVTKQHILKTLYQIEA